MHNNNWRNRLHSEFKAFNDKYNYKKGAFRSALDKRKSEQASRRHDNEGLMIRAGIPVTYQKDCKVERSRWDD